MESNQVPEKVTNGLFIVCYCGLSRLLPAGLTIGEEIRLDPCPRCGSPFYGVYTGSTVEVKG